ncbi:MAG TPA: transcription-repair coupling factor [Candidatus Ozemobacteraceae bacterium]|nr:transcription-repair coupling factor [Candidatus Ozemobacteraceae bacterium]
MTTLSENVTTGEGRPVLALFAGLERCPDGPFTGLSGTLAPMLLAWLAHQARVTLVLVPTPERAVRLAQETRTWLGSRGGRVATFLPDRASVYDQTAAEAEVTRGRLAAFAMETAGGGLVIAPVCAAAERFMSPRAWRDATIRLAVGDVAKPGELAAKLTRLGYERSNLVNEPGQFAVRGGIVDVFSPHAELPVRLDFFGDELETVKSFSPDTQRTLEKIGRAVLTPALEHPLEEETLRSAAAAVESAIAGLDATKAELLHRRLERFTGRPDSRDIRELAPFLAPGHSFLWDAWPTARLLIENHDQFAEELEIFISDQRIRYSAARDLVPLLPPDAYYHDVGPVLESLKARHAAAFSRFRQPDPAGLAFDVEPLPPAADPTRESLLKELQKLVRENWAVAIVIADSERYHNLRGLLGERKLPLINPRFPWQLAYGKIVLLEGPGRRGFMARAEKVIVLGEDDIYPNQAKPSVRRHATADKAQAFISQLVPGDLVVHSEHGIAEYRGIQTMTAAGTTREYLLLQYAGSDKLYVPTDQVHKVQKYIGMEGARPAVHSLNSKVWEGQKRRVQKNVELIARELLDLYAKRHAGPGFAFPPDGELQMQMEERFPHTETPDQDKAIVSVKNDMEADTPMDRLICGDVGYGKTEVAMRAAFKAVCAGKQVAVLAPTTLLAFQHHQTFLNRFDGFPVSVDLVCRLRKPADQKETLKKASSGKLDVLIGTHRILSSDVRFKDLGLLIVDEEQRFGVKHKEKLKQFKSSIDVLTLAATPIPRTLQMALSGIRQISVIDTPPEQRRPVQTYVAPFDPTWAKRAIIEELKRGGQVFYVYNRVETIDRKAAFLRDLVPEARVGVAHGQMAEEEVERTMLAFIRGEFDVLLASTIVESGLDIPNANTLIVDESERLGLSQMYQLRGRVGRSSRQAFAFFFYSKGKRLTQEAAERLATIEEHTALGSGFRIAMRDLQIRGAGNVLGEEQSGHIAAVGFALYIELLEEAVTRLRGGGIVRAPEVSIEIPVSALFPAHYIPDEETRIEMYARLARCADLGLLELLREEVTDRFGELPVEGRRLFAVTRLRLLAGQAGVRKVSRVLNRLRFEFDPARRPDIGALLNANAMFYRRIALNPADPQAVLLQLSGEEGDELVEMTGEFLGSLGPAETPATKADSAWEPVPVVSDTAAKRREQNIDTYPCDITVIQPGIEMPVARTVRTGRAGRRQGDKRPKF